LSFESLYEAVKHHELTLVDGGMCHWHLRHDGQLTIREIISTKSGAGLQMLNRLKSVPGATSIFAKCPSDLDSNEWYSRRGFILERIENGKKRPLHHWRLPIVRHWSPNAGKREIIFCAGGTKRYAEIALDTGFLYGARLPGFVYYRPYFVDQDYRNPDRSSYMKAVKEYRPFMATVMDLERDEQLPEVLDWAHEIAEFVQVIVIIPKVVGIIKKLPRNIKGKLIRLGYSVDTTYGKTTVPTEEFRGWQVHLLGGDPTDQLSLTLVMNVWSVDTNYHLKQANGVRHWQPISNSVVRSKNRHWPTLDESGGFIHQNATYEAFRRSSHAIMNQWLKLTARESNPQLMLPFA